MSTTAYIFLAVAAVAFALSYVIVFTKHGETEDGFVSIDLTDRLGQSVMLHIAGLVSILLAALVG